jgi:hypothetical protein
MAILFELDEDTWREWLSTRPEVIRKVAERLLPNRLYRLTTTGQRVTLEAYREDGTVTVGVRGQFNRTPFEQEVFGVNPDDLIECDLPGPHERVGAILTNLDEIKMYQDAMRPIVLALRIANPDDPYGKKKQ